MMRTVIYKFRWLIVVSLALIAGFLTNGLHESGNAVNLKPAGVVDPEHPSWEKSMPEIKKEWEGVPKKIEI